MKNQTMSTKQLTIMALFATIATVVMFFETPIPFMPPFLKLDFSGAVVLLGAYLLGPVQGLLIAALKSLIHLLSTTTGGVGELADFFMTGTFVFVASFIYNKVKTTKSVVWGSVAATIAMAIVGVVTNKFLLLPFYSKLMPIDAVIEMCRAVNPLIGSVNGYLLFGILPFNLFKGIILSIIAALLFQRLNKPGMLGDQFSQ